MRLVKTLLDALAIAPGETILEVGCGTGVVTRVLAEHTGGRNSITGMDINAFLRSEAETLGAAAGFADVIEIFEGDAHDLPVADAAFDVTLSVTLLEEVDADRAIAEMARVTRPGGRVGAMVRSLDMAPVVSAKGCADASLYRRLAGAGLSDIEIHPSFNTSAHLTPVQLANATSRLDEDERSVFDAAVADAGEGFFIAMPMHLAACRKP